MNSIQRHVFIADDDPLTIKILSKHFTDWGYLVETLDDGTKALDRVIRAEPPHLVVLDWMMPGASGVDICRELRNREEGKFCYVLMVTSKTESSDMIEALNAGAHDFVSKPINPELLRSKVKVAERLLEHELVLEVERRFWNLHADQMETLAAERAKQLVHSDRMASIGVMSAGIAHEINNPTSFISGNLQTFERFWPKLEVLLLKGLENQSEDSKQIQFIIDEMPQLIAGMRNGVARISKIVKGLKSFAHQREAEKSKCKVEDMVEQALQLTHNVLKNKVQVETKLDENLPNVNVDPQKIEQVMINLIVNASHAMEKCSDAVLRISADVEGDSVTIGIKDSGPGIPEENFEKIWTPFFTTKEVGKGTGLGLHICRDIIEEHGGKIEVSNDPDGGAHFRIALPAVPKISKEEG